LDFIRKCDIDTFFVTNSKTYEIVRTLELLGKKGIIVGYDLLPENTKHLVEGRIQFLIHQAPRQQASLSLKSLVENLLFKKEFPKKQLLPIEIINSENLESYL
jgi:LacI family transcriptional regulator, galactose operon repressor